MEKPLSASCRPDLPSAPDGDASLSSGEVLLRLEGAHTELLAICDRLEGIADSLPNTLNLIKCRETAGDLVPVVVRAHRIEEEQVFPHIGGDSRAAMQKTLDHLRTEHCEDECFAEELADALRQAGEGRVQPETLGYMLRGFFEAMRRHINFERERFVNLAGNR